MSLLYAHLGKQSRGFDKLSEHCHHAQKLEVLFVFYDVFTYLCERKGVSPNKALTDCGISRTSTAKWREGAIPRGVTLQKLADYFGVTTDYLLTGEETKKAPTQAGEREIDDRQMKAAFLGGLADGLSAEEIDEYWDDARDYIGYKIQQKKNKPD